MTYTKYPRTKHLPWSPGVSSDDLVQSSVDCFYDKQVVVTEKMDGENTTLYRDYLHARSLSNRPHPSRDWIRGYHGSIAHLLPLGWRFCGENLYAQHSIKYLELPSFFLLFSIWNDSNICLSWAETEEWAQLLEMSLVPVLYSGPFSLDIQNIAVDVEHSEGYVVRNSSEFAFGDFSNNVAKWVRGAHVQSSEHWMHKGVIPNTMKSK